MTLNCSVHNCVYNTSGTCYAGSIEILGSDATSTKNTTCATFTPEDSNRSFSNNTSNTFTTSSDIKCKAKKCTYNSDYICTATSVHINLNNACCDTFICK
ncbi:MULTISPECIES: DUF1540 domain-containing protein [unclassified Romboutsia]|uniref:DUF1540 domain-containing protein n=1 Tax=unclassified Romboutsia TaxID=2626894 RepID=UPI0013DE3E05|nr:MULTISPECIES: DUF1540 domain-containing protein [unclassified Romboutsia]